LPPWGLELGRVFEHLLRVHPRIDAGVDLGDPAVRAHEEADPLGHAQAESHAEEMYSPNTTAERVLEAEAPVDAELEAVGSLEVGMDDGEVEGEEDDFDFASSQTFTTRTMAGLLERQGDRGRADSIREVLGRSGGPKSHASEPRMDAAEALASEGLHRAPSKADEAERARVLATLERWLHNLGRGVA